MKKGIYMAITVIVILLLLVLAGGYTIKKISDWREKRQYIQELASLEKSNTDLERPVMIYYGDRAQETDISQPEPERTPEKVPETVITETPDSEEEPKIPPVSQNGYTQYEGRYYYELLDFADQESYRRIQETVAAADTHVNLERLVEPDLLNRIFMSVYMDHPEYFWLENHYTYTQYPDHTEIDFNLNCSGAELERRRNEIETAAETILAGLDPFADTYGKVKYVFESLVLQTDYNHEQMEDPSNQNIYSVFGRKLSVCAGYARATQYLLNELGIECIYVTGRARNDEHAWNIVQIDGAYYYVDTTWGDPTFLDEETKAQKQDKINYAYLCTPAQILQNSHTINTEYEFPECAGDFYNYYTRKDRFFDRVDEEELRAVLKADIDAGKDTSEFQFATPQLYEEGLRICTERLFQEVSNYYMEQRGINSVRWTYWNYESCMVLEVQWQS